MQEAPLLTDSGQEEYSSTPLTHRLVKSHKADKNLANLTKYFLKTSNIRFYSGVSNLSIEKEIYSPWRINNFIMFMRLALLVNVLLAEIMISLHTGLLYLRHI